MSILPKFEKHDTTKTELVKRIIARLEKGRVASKVLDRLTKLTDGIKDPDMLS